MLKPKKPISTSHEPGLGSSHAPKSERGALVHWVGHGSLFLDIAAMEKQQSFLNLFVVCCLNMFNHVYCFANVCQFWVFQHVETNDLSHKVTRQICGMGKTSRGLQIIIC